MFSRIEHIGIFEDDIRFLAKSSSGHIFKIIDGARELIFESQAKNPVATLRIVEDVREGTKREIIYCLYKGRERDTLKKRVRTIRGKRNHARPIQTVSNRELDEIIDLLSKVIDPDETWRDEIGTRTSASYMHIPD